MGVVGHSSKSLRSNPLRGGTAETPIASREDSDSGIEMSVMSAAFLGSGHGEELLDARCLNLTATCGTHGHIYGRR
jgi:hypothetical protein